MLVKPDGEGNLSLLQEVGLLNNTILIRKEFRVKGSMREDGQKEKLTCISLIQQINEAKVARYDDEDIMNGVIRAVTNVSGQTVRHIL